MDDPLPSFLPDLPWRFAGVPRWLERAAHGDVFSQFHAEAGIAAEHCFFGADWRPAEAGFPPLIPEHSPSVANRFSVRTR